MRRGALAGLPFLPDDATVGSETELQVAVLGERSAVDLPLSIEGSSYFADTRRRARSGDASPRVLSELELWLDGNQEQVWENSWVRFPVTRLGDEARRVLRRDLCSDKSRAKSPLRADIDRFYVEEGGETLLRVPVSYLLKLSLADAAAPLAATSRAVERTVSRLLDCFTNDNSSPEITSFRLASLAQGGRGVARETAKRYLLTQLLVAHAEHTFGLAERGQRLRVFYAPQAPLRQRRLNGAVSDAFYRELFLNPCLSGWDRGEDKHAYMELCHQALSRSHWNALGKLKEAGIIHRNLVVMPQTSNLSLANNGTHLSFGSRRLSAREAAGERGFDAAAAKRLADGAIKIAEHFLPLFVGSFSASPYRFDFSDFHPETLLGCLPHELDFTHLRMLWRRWRGKARNHFLGRSLTPFGPAKADRLLARVLGLEGDFVPDFRLIDYPVAWMSTESCPALDGRLGNQDRLRGDLHDQGVLDRRMAMYLPLRARELDRHGYAGFEARHFSVFPSLEADLAHATELQALVLAFAWKVMADGRFAPEHIPDLPWVESERRQALFAAAAGIPTFYVRSDTPNRLLTAILARTAEVRSSRRYPGHQRVPLDAYRRALLTTLVEEAPGLVEVMGAETALREVRRQLAGEAPSAAKRLTSGILVRAGAKSVWKLSADELNAAADGYYREELRRHHTAEAWEVVAEDLLALERRAQGEAHVRRELARLLGLGSMETFLDAARPWVAGASVPPPRLAALIQLLVLSEEITDTEDVCEPISTWTAETARLSMNNSSVRPSSPFSTPG